MDHSDALHSVGSWNSPPANSPADYPGREIERAILEKLDVDSPSHVLELATAVNDHPITVDQTCAILQKKGQIYSIGGGFYRISPDGNQEVGER